ncbi:MAG: iron ABC transporter permease [Acidobacteria bacterium]|nr:iron ABC transporter permease [Acidobacteriota bacterium]
MPLDARAALRAELDRHRLRQWLLIVAGLVILALVSLASISLGVESMSPLAAIRVILAPLLPVNWRGEISDVQVAILQNLRLPRTLMAIVGGAGLSLAGVAMQGITRNPLASPYTLGISPAAAFGASLAILLGLSSIPGGGQYFVVGGAFLSALACAGLVLAFSTLRDVTSTILVLGGVGLTYLFIALMNTVQFVATEQQLPVIIQWTFGSLNGTTWDEVAIAGGIVLLVLPVLQAHAWALNAFASGGDEVAASLGFAVSRTRRIVWVAAVLATAAVVSFTGVITFVGLVAPHIARMLIGGDHRTLVPMSAIVGAVLLLVADLVGRLAFAPVIIPVGIVVAYLGVPLFLHLLLSRRQELLV